MRWALFLLITCGLVILAACSQDTPSGVDENHADDRLQVLATTTIVGDIVANVGGEAIALQVLLPANSDPHTFEASPQDLARLSQADLVFANGAGLEEFLEPLLESAGAQDKLINLSDGLELLESQAADEHEHHDGDPHTWNNPNNVSAWVERIQAELSALDPANAETYRANASAYQVSLDELDSWIQGRVSQLSPGQRVLVTDHLTFAYFAQAYGFNQVGAIIPGYSTLAEPSAQEIAQLESAIRSLGVKAIFVGNTVNPNLAQRVAQDTGTQLVFLFTGSLSKPGQGADSYLEYMRYNVNAIVDALK